MNKIQMVDLQAQYADIKEEVDKAILDVVASAAFVRGPEVTLFENELRQYLNVRDVISCANGTDALQVATMALGLKPGDEIIVPSFTYAATAEVIALLGFKPLMTDVLLDTFEMDLQGVEERVSEKTKAIIPVHLFGQTTNMDEVMSFALKHKLFVIEDNAQAIGSDFIGDKYQGKAGTIGHIGCTSFFPSKNLGCYGDGGAIYTNDEALGQRIRQICNHGEIVKYYHDIIGCNSRLDAIQAAVLRIKLRHLNDYNQRRKEAAHFYNERLSQVEQIITPFEAEYSTHVFHQYTLRVTDGQRNALKEHLQANGIPTGIYYPLPLYKQKAYAQYVHNGFSMKNTELLCEQVISLPIHSHLNEETQTWITDKIIDYFSTHKV